MKRFISNLLTVCFICYMILLVYFLFFSEEYGRNEPYTTYQYNLELFREIKRYLMYREQIGMVYFAINLLGNVVVFMPFGFLVPVLYREQVFILKGIILEADCLLRSLDLPSVLSWKPSSS